MKVKFVGSESVADNIMTFHFSSDKKISNIAGQFTELYLPHSQKDSRGDKRWFTFSSSPTEENWSITTKFASEKGSSFKQALKNLQPDDEVSMASPMGDFVLPKDSSLPLVFVAGGIGCTPFRSITKYLADNGQNRNITLIYAVSSASELAFEELFSRYGDRFIKVVGEKLSGKKILELAGPPPEKKRYIYLSGPEAMIENLKAELKNEGVNKKQIHTDSFPGYNII